jgi:hypothetical protein
MRIVRETPSLNMDDLIDLATGIDQKIQRAEQKSAHLRNSDRRDLKSCIIVWRPLARVCLSIPAANRSRFPRSRRSMSSFIDRTFLGTYVAKANSAVLLLYFRFVSQCCSAFRSARMSEADRTIGV